MEEELLRVFQEAALVAETNDDLEELVDLPDDDIEYEDQQLLLDDLIDLTNSEFGNEDSEKNVDNYDIDTDNSSEGDEFNEDEFGAEFVQSLQNE
jgi:hypothetical protein